MKCPNCNSENVSFISNTQKRGFSVADACCGWLLFNWIGILCGAIGANKTKTQDYWVCNNCGRKFQAKKIQKYNQQLIEQEAYTPQIEEKKTADVLGLTEPKTYIERTASYSGSLSVEALLKRAMLYLEDSEWEKAYEYAENALDVDAECAEAYLAKFLAEYNINSADDIPSECEEMLMEIESLTELTSYGKAMRFADGEFKAKLEGYNNETIYRFAANLQDKSGFGTDIPAQLKETIRLFRSISGYKDADEKAEKCKEKIRNYENGVNRENYKKACNLLKEAEKAGEYQIADYINAVKQFKECGDYSDAVDKYIECREAMYNIADEFSNNPTSIHDIDNAILLFQNTFGYKDSVARSKELENKRDDIGRELRKKKIDATIAGWKEEYQKNKKRINIIAISSVTIIILLIAVPKIADSVKENRQQKKLLNSYNSAVELFNEGSYAEANEIFVTLGDYEDSKNLALESVYQNGLKLAEEKKYSEAAAEFDKNISYKDSYTLSAKYEKYAEAYQLYESGKYDKAVKAFEKLGDYEMAERSEDYLAEQQAIENEEKYISAMTDFENGNFIESADKFKKLGEYKDSAEMAERSKKEQKRLFDEQKALENEEAYISAMTDFESGNFTESANKFKKLGDYKDSAEMAERSKEEQKRLLDEQKTLENEETYIAAMADFNNGNYDSAISLFDKLGDYKDSDEKCKEAKYEYATKLYDDGFLADAKELLSELGNYKNADELLKEYILEDKYLYAMFTFVNKQYELSVMYFNELGNYKDSAEKYIESAYLYAEQLYNEGSYDLAKNYYQIAGDYKDATDKISSVADKIRESNATYKWERTVTLDGGCVYYDELQYNIVTKSGIPECHVICTNIDIVFDNSSYSGEHIENFIADHSHKLDWDNVEKISQRDYLYTYISSIENIALIDKYLFVTIENEMTDMRDRLNSTYDKHTYIFNIETNKQTSLSDIVDVDALKKDIAESAAQSAGVSREYAQSSTWYNDNEKWYVNPKGFTVRLGYGCTISLEKFKLYFK